MTPLQATKALVAAARAAERAIRAHGNCLHNRPATAEQTAMYQAGRVLDLALHEYDATVRANRKRAKIAGYAT